MINKILVKKTGDVFDIETNNAFEIRHMSFSFEFDIDDKVKDEIEEKITFKNPPGSIKTNRRGKYYTCVNGEVYHEDDVVVGLDEIREYKIKNLEI